MQEFVTKLLQDEPAFVLIGQNSLLTQKVLRELKDKNLRVVFLDVANLNSTHAINELNNAYKIIWVYTSLLKEKDLYKQTISILQTQKSPLFVIMPFYDLLVTNKNFDLDTTQQQFILDVNYYLKNSSFIFAKDIFGLEDGSNVIDKISSNISEGYVYDLGFIIEPIHLQDFVFELYDLIIRPNKQPSIVIKGQAISSSYFIQKVIHNYEILHKNKIEIVKQTAQIYSTLPFSTKEKVIHTNIEDLVGKYVYNLKSPQKKLKKVLPKPNLEPQKSEINESKVINYQTFSQDTYQLSNNQDKRLEFAENHYQEVVVSQEYKPIKNIRESSTDTNIDINQVPLKTLKSDTKSVVKPEPKTEVKPLDINDELNKIFKEKRTETKVERVTNITKSTKKIEKKSKRRKVLFYGGLITTIFGTFALTLTLMFIVSTSLLRQQLFDTIIKNQNEDLVKTDFKSIKFLSSFVNLNAVFYSKFFQHDTFAMATQLGHISDQILKLSTQIDKTEKSVQDFTFYLLSGEINDPQKHLSLMENNITTTFSELSILQASLDQLKFLTEDKNILSAIDKMDKKISEVSDDLNTYNQIKSIIPSLIGVDERKTYALFLQNNHELRATGGFLQSVAIITFEKGTIISTKVYSVDELDKKLNGEVFPPEEITEHLGEKNWYLRDANWDPDFPKTAEKLDWFLQKSIGLKTDGVLAINIKTLEKLLTATGPVSLPKYNEVLTKDNVSERMEAHSEVLLVEKPDNTEYSQYVLESILQKVRSLENTKYSKLFSELKKSFLEKEAFISVTNKSDETVLANLGWTGSIIKPQCPSTLIENSKNAECVVDNIFHVESNVGINKANYYLNKTINHNVVLNKNYAYHQRMITYENTATSNSWPKGSYKVFHRVYLPKEVSFESVKIDGVSLEKQSIIEKIEDNFKVISFRSEVPIQRKSVLELSYSTPFGNANEILEQKTQKNKEVKEEFAYVFFNQKQQGVDNVSLKVKVTPNLPYSPVLIAPSAILVNKDILFDSNDAKTSLYGIKFEKN